jgi:hypothetical protein
MASKSVKPFRYGLRSNNAETLKWHLPERWHPMETAGNPAQNEKDIEQAWHSYEVSRQPIRRYDETIRSKAEKLQALTLQAYRLGEVELLNLINAQTNLPQQQQRYLLALRDFYQQLIALESLSTKI